MKNKIGLITYFKVINYGAVLQAYASYYALSTITKSKVELIDYTHKIFLDKFSTKIFVKSRGFKGNIKHFINYFVLRRKVKKTHGFKKFVKQNFILSKNVNSVTELNDVYDKIIVGSDQVWNLEYTKGEFDYNFLLKGVNKLITSKVAFSSSAGSYRFNEPELEDLCDSLRDFDYIGVREQGLKSQLDTKLDNVKAVLDPTFLLDKEKWNELFKLENEKLSSEKYVLIYTFDNNPLCFKTARYIAEQRGLKVYSITSSFIKNRLVDKQLSSLSPSGFLKYFYNADFIISNSFHGTCFSINFQKPFYSIIKRNNPMRVQDMLKTLGLEKRLISDFSQISSEIDFTLETNSKLELVRKDSIDFLKKSIL